MWIVTLLIICGTITSKVYGEPEPPEGRIVGGTLADIRQYPYQLSLQYHLSHICGASIVSPLHAMTASHCFVGKEAKAFTVYAGSSHLSTNGTRKQVLSFITHPKYDPDTMDYDVAIIKFDSRLQFSNKISEVTLPRRGRVVPAGVYGVVTGWGYTQENGMVSPDLLSVRVPVVQRSECQKLYTNDGDVTPRMICAGIMTGGKDACQGDSGGPFVSNGEQVGIVSWGVGCARPNSPGVYSDVASLVPWIKVQLNN